MARSSPTTPLIHVTSDHQNVAIDNPVFTFDDFENDVGLHSSVSSRSRSQSISSCSSAGRRLFNSSPWRASLYSTSGSTIKAVENTLSVPGAFGNESRRHSESSLMDLPLTSRSRGSHATLNIDYLSEPRRKAPRSPGGKSMTSTWSEFVVANRRSSISSACTNYSSQPPSGVSSVMSERLLKLFRAFSRRTQELKEKTIQPPTPSTGSSLPRSVEPPIQRHRLDSYVHMESRMGSMMSNIDSLNDQFVGCGRWQCKVPRRLKKFKIPKTFDPNGYAYLSWLFLVTLAYMYNITVIILRSSFPYQTADNLVYWLICDYTADFIYLVDIFIVKIRLKFVRNGLIEEDPKQARHHYLRKIDFKLDILSLLPLDFFYLVVGIQPLLRSSRFLKIKTFWEFYDRCDRAAKNGHVVRVIKTMTYMLYLIHVETCGYYGVSVYEGINSTRWVYNGEGNAYIRCFYLATKTATSIGNNPKPTNELEWMFMTLYWLSGVFVFALLIGQIRDIYTSANRSKVSYRKAMDATLHHMQNLNVPKELQEKVRTWFNYTWSTQKTLDENSLLSYLPKKMITDIAISVHFDTLSQVQLFQDCDKNLLFDLVSKLRPVLYLPGDNIITKGEVGTEMYIVVHGLVEVLAPSGDVLATLGKGSVFGEISLLALAGGNRRTATVRSKGFSNVFTLSKADFERAMKDYPDAQALLKKRAKKLLALNAKTMKKRVKVETEEIIRSNVVSTPKLLKTVIKVMDPESKVAKWLGAKPRYKFKNKGKTNHKLKAKNSPFVQLPRVESVDDRHSNSSEDLGNLSDDEDELLVVEQTEMSVGAHVNELCCDAGTQNFDEDSEDDIDHLISTIHSVDRTTPKTPISFNTRKTSSTNIVDTKDPGSRKSSGGKSKSPITSLNEKSSSGKTVHKSKSSLNSTISGSPFGTPFKRKNVICPVQNEIADILDSPEKRSKSVIDFSKKSSNGGHKLWHNTWDGVDIEKDMIPAENKILCSVEIHREKSASPQVEINETKV